MITAVEAVERLASALGGGSAAELAASALIEADALGLPRFGIALLQEWEATPAPQRSHTDSGAVAWRDCTNSFAPLAVATATLDLEQAAREFGIAAVFLRGVKGFGRLAPFVRRLADAGLVGLAGAEGPPFVAPDGGSRPVIGTNPVALAMGRGAERVVIDLATAAATMADIRKARASGTHLAEGVALDDRGQPTTVASEVTALLPRGGRTGSLVGLMVELLAGVAGGGRGDPNGRGIFLMAFDPSAAGRRDEWQDTLVALKRDWSDCGGHWPRGGGLPSEAKLAADFEARLDGYLARISGQGED